MYDPLPIRELPTGIQFSVRIHPGARREGFLGIYGDALKFAVAAPAVDGRANEALLRLLSKLLDVPRANIEFLSGQTSRTKLLRVLDISPEKARTRLAAVHRQVL